MKKRAMDLNPEGYYIHMDDNSRMRITEIGTFSIAGDELIEISVGDGRFVGIFEPTELVEVELA